MKKVGCWQRPLLLSSKMSTRPQTELQFHVCCKGSVILIARKGAACGVARGVRSPNPPFIPSRSSGQDLRVLSAFQFHTQREVNQRTRHRRLSPTNHYFLDLDLSILNSQLFFLYYGQQNRDGSMQISCWYSGKINIP